MAKLYYRYSTMNSGKSLDVIKVVHNYVEREKNVLVFTSSIDTRSGENKIKSRTGLECNAVSIKENDNIYRMVKSYPNKIDACIFDEVQFLQPIQIDQISDIVDKLNVSCLCYGLSTDFQSNLFPASQRLFELADKKEELKTICWCNKKAIMNARVIDGEVIRNGEQIQVGGNESYVSLCRKHYKEGNLGKSKEQKKIEDSIDYKGDMICK